MDVKRAADLYAQGWMLRQTVRSWASAGPLSAISYVVPGSPRVAAVSRTSHVHPAALLVDDSDQGERGQERQQHPGHRDQADRSLVSSLEKGPHLHAGAEHQQQKPELMAGAQNGCV